MSSLVNSPKKYYIKPPASAVSPSASLSSSLSSRPTTPVSSLHNNGANHPPLQRAASPKRVVRSRESPAKAFDGDLRSSVNLAPPKDTGGAPASKVASTHLVSRPRSPLRRPTSSALLRESHSSFSSDATAENPAHERSLSVRSSMGSFTPNKLMTSALPRSSAASSEDFSQDLASSGQGNVRVLVRARPFVPREVAAGSRCLLSMDSSADITIIHSEETINGSDKTDTASIQRRSKLSKEFVFDASLWSVDKSTSNRFIGQPELYKTVGKEFLDHSFNGYHTCILAYGQTGSGKSYTMIGSDNEPGIIPQTCYDLFDRVKQMTTSTTSFTVKVTFFEIYNENVYDLLTSRSLKGQPTPLKVRESPVDGPYVKDLSSHSVHNFEEVENLLRKGNELRATASTNMNDSSSRSHAVFTLSLKKIVSDPILDETTEEMNARIRFVDLAGSERANSTGASGSRLREGSNINKSLTTLGRVINILSESALSSKKKELVPYRDSTLTWLLKDSLGGNSKTAMIACVSPCDYEETLSTLRYASRAKHIRTRAVVNQDIISAAERDQKLLEMQDTINKLQDTLATTTNSQKLQSDSQVQELEKFRKVIQYYEERAEVEESKRRALLQENDTVKRHIKLMAGHVKDMRRVIDRPVTLPESLLEEWNSLMTDVGNFREGLTSDILRHANRSVVA
ncbi:P-loop containing nucleoside triphosphate hydrolase protein [Myxozyma melibiosi]|uniref:Kinesin-like protein n=1 Tax=Myxozyma melibiosi TaxID=54550 RepID=A0ABR1FAK7_9ASCO